MHNRDVIEDPLKKSCKTKLIIKHIPCLIFLIKPKLAEQQDKNSDTMTMCILSSSEIESA